jgi:hypothetical protein
MGVAQLSRSELTSAALSRLHLPEERRLDAPGVLAGLLRQAAAMRCPCTPNALVRAVSDSIKDLVDDDPQQALKDVLERIVEYGDLLEIRDQEAATSRLSVLFAAPPSFVRRQDRVFLVGIADETVEALPEGLYNSVRYRDVTRYIETAPEMRVLPVLAAAGYMELPVGIWTQAPRARSAAQVVEQYRSKLCAIPHTAGIEGLTIIADDRPVTYYKGRWTLPKRQDGDFVGRRPQRYGAPLWCLVRLSNGVPVAICDLPVENRGWRGCDEAWYLQAAIDAIQGRPQIVCIQRSGMFDGGVTLKFFSPLPRWVNRRLQCVGAPLEPINALLSFSLPMGGLEEELKLLQTQLWVRVEEEQGQRKAAQR